MKYNELHSNTRWLTDFDREHVVYQHVAGLTQSFPSTITPSESVAYNKSFTSRTNGSTYCNNKTSYLAEKLQHQSSRMKLQKLTPAEYAHDETMDIQNAQTY
jgi:hypothetical protein